MRALILSFLLCCSVLTSRGQQTEIYLATQSGHPFSNDYEQLFWNWSIGAEQYLVNKLSVSLSYRKMFSLAGDDFTFSSYSSLNGNNYSYSEKVSAFALDLESKFFFDDPEEGWYLSSGFSYLHMKTDVTVEDYGLSPSLFTSKSYEDDAIIIFPLSLKTGHRSSSDTFVFDYFFGISYNMGIDNIVHKYESYFEYAPLKKISFIIGIKAGIKV